MLLRFGSYAIQFLNQGLTDEGKEKYQITYDYRLCLWTRTLRVRVIKDADSKWINFQMLVTLGQRPYSFAKLDSQFLKRKEKQALRASLKNQRTKEQGMQALGVKS